MIFKKISVVLFVPHCTKLNILTFIQWKETDMLKKTKEKQMLFDFQNISVLHTEI